MASLKLGDHGIGQCVARALTAPVVGGSAHVLRAPARASEARAQRARQPIPVRSHLRVGYSHGAAARRPCAWTYGNAVSAWDWLIGWLLGRETTSLREPGLGL
jgi:hypothetical protein